MQPTPPLPVNVAPSPCPECRAFFDAHGYFALEGPPELRGLRGSGVGPSFRCSNPEGPFACIGVRAVRHEDAARAT